MNKVTTAALAGLVAVTATANASMSRVNGFGAAAAYIADVQNIWTLPGVVASNKNATYFELGKKTSNVVNSAYAGNAAVANAWGGVDAEVGPGVLGVWFNRPYNELSNLAGGATVPSAVGSGGTPSTTFLTPTQSIDLLYGFGLSDSTTLGVAINRASNSLKTETVSSGTTTVGDQSSSDLGFGLGLEQKGVGPIDLLEVGLTLNLRGDANTNDNGSVKNKITQGGMDTDLRIGGDIAGSEGKFGRVELGLNLDSLDTKSEPAAAAAANSFVESKQSALAWNLGYAMGKSSDKGMGLVGLMLQGNSASRDEANNGTAVNKLDSSNLYLLASTAAEAKVKEWLTLRAGLSSKLFYTGSVVTETGAAGATTKVTKSTDQPTGTTGNGGLGDAGNAIASFGTSITLGSLVIDGVLNQDLLYSGTYLVSGVAGALSSQVSATWAW